MTSLKIWVKKYKFIIAANLIFIVLVATVLFSISHRLSARVQNIIVPVLKDSTYTGEVGTSTPIKVSIPAVGIEGEIVPVGIGASGNMAVPVKFEDVGWYKYGPTPGRVGNSVVAGHLDNGKGKPAVFYNLSNVRVGDDVFVENAEGEKTRFIVREIRLVDYNNPPLEEIFGKSDKERLNLITCDGTWIPEKKMYSERLVVFTERVK
jgi:sortase A